MAIKRITKYGEEILRRQTDPVDFSKIKPILADLLSDMRETCRAVKGVGLSANQIGVNLRVAVILIKEENIEKEFVIINPVIKEQSDPVIELEGCLSVPGIFAKVKRYNKVKVSALNERGLPVEITADGLLARALQHETDHLNGKFFVDRLDVTEKENIKPLIKKLTPLWQKTDESKGIFYEGPFFGDT